MFRVCLPPVHLLKPREAGLLLAALSHCVSKDPISLRIRPAASGWHGICKGAALSRADVWAPCWGGAGICLQETPALGQVLLGSWPWEGRCGSDECDVESIQ